jgi:hypothetical protein
VFESILSHGEYRHLKQAATLVFIALLLYLSAPPDEPPNGGTWQGYALGGVSAALILFLLWFGIRKRQYHCTETSLAGWASAHVYLGISLPVVASLHCGFQFGWNVHTLAYALMMLVVLSGFYGLYAYLRFPAAVTANRNGTSRREMIAAIARLDETGLTLAEALSTEAHHHILRDVVETRLTATGSSFLHGLRGGISGASKQAAQGPDRPGAENFLRKYLNQYHNPAEINQVVELLKVLNERQAMVNRVQRDIRYHSLMKCWLMLHVPVSCALPAAVLIHVISVFFYW